MQQKIPAKHYLINLYLILTFVRSTSSTENVYCNFYNVLKDK